MWTSKNKPTTYFHKAINHYGKENFKIECVYILKPTDDWEEIEKYYIKLYDSTNHDKGYNMTIGGEKPPSHCGSNNCKSKLSEIQHEEIINKLLLYNLPMSEIAKEYKVDQCTIERINNGIAWNDSNINYPIRKMRYNENIALKIINDLLYTDLKIKDIAKNYGMHYQNISDINRGKTYKYLHTFDIPIRKNKLK